MDYRTNLSGYIFATKARIDNRKKNLLNSNIFPSCLYNMVLFGLLVAETVSLVWGTRANFKGFRVLTSLQRRRSPEANQTLQLHDVWTSPGLLHIYTFSGLLPPDGISPRAKFTLRVSLAFSYWQR